MTADRWSEQYRIHNGRGSDGPCMCEGCQDEREAINNPGLMADHNEQIDPRG